MNANTEQGWPNRETWCMHLWLTNDESIYNAVVAIVRAIPEHHEALYRVRLCIDGVLDTASEDTAGIVTDLMRCAVVRVDWDAVVNSLREDLS